MMTELALAQAAPATGQSGQAIFFWLFAAIAVIGAITMVTRRNVVAAVMSLIATILALAALYVMLYAHFLAIIQVIVYAGAIMVLFIFVILILNKEEDEPWALRGLWVKVLAGAGTAYVLVRLVSVLWQVPRRFPEVAWQAGELDTFGTTASVGRQLFTSYLFPFEAVSLVLLIAVVGALVLAPPRARSRVIAGPAAAADPGHGGQP